MKILPSNRRSLTLIRRTIFLCMALSLPLMNGISPAQQTGNPPVEQAEAKKDQKQKKQAQIIKGKITPKPEWYQGKKVEKPARKETQVSTGEEDLSTLKKSAKEEIKSIIVLLTELPAESNRVLFGPVFFTDRRDIYGSKTDFSLKWVGYKISAGLKHRGFPWKGADLSETLIGSFLYASGTNIGFAGGKEFEENRFYTNYINEMITLKQRLPLHFATAFTLDSRQYFFIERHVPDGFTMPDNHANLFPRIDFNLEMLHEEGIDQLTEGFGIETWAGYGFRSRWHSWGEEDYMQPGASARTFMIYCATFTAGLLFGNNHNLVLRARYKGGIDNDFLTRPRFGGTIDNARLDVVHGFTLDYFRVNEFGLINFRYGFDIIKRLRLNLFCDYAHIFSPGSKKEDVMGTAYGFRVLAWGGLPVWFTHGMGVKLFRADNQVQHVFMIMTAAGW